MALVLRSVCCHGTRRGSIITNATCILMDFTSLSFIVAMGVAVVS